VRTRLKHTYHKEENMNHSKVKYVFGILLMCLVLVSCYPPPPPQNFIVGIATYPGFGPGFVAKERGYFGALPVDFSRMDDFTVRQNAFTSGKTHATISTLDSYAFESGQGVKGKVILVLDESSGVDGIVVSPAIKSAQDLKGKKIAYTRGSPSHFLLVQYLRMNGLSMKDIARVEVDDPTRAGEAFLSGSVDAAVTWEPNITQIVNSGKGRVLVDTKAMPDFIFDVMVVSLDVYENRQKDIQTFVNGWLKAVEFIKTNQTEAYSIMAKNLNIPETEFPSMAQGLRYADIARNRELMLPPVGSKAIKIFDDATKVWGEEKLLSTPQIGGQLITPEFIVDYK
jgi:NitT/TauT family transport system substrate-binding protein